MDIFKERIIEESFKFVYDPSSPFYEIALRQAFAEGLYSMFLSLTGFMIVVFLAVCFVKAAFKDASKFNTYTTEIGEEISIKWQWLLGLAILLFLSFLFTAHYLQLALTRLINPDWFAYEYVLELLSK